MITFDSAEKWQEWFDATFPRGAKAAAVKGTAWVVTPRIYVEDYADGYVQVVFSPWDYSRLLLCRFKGIDAVSTPSYAHVQYETTDVASGYPPMIFSGDVASADAETVRELRAEAIAEGRF